LHARPIVFFSMASSRPQTRGNEMDKVQVLDRLLS
jgi:hypothetical protein